MRSSGGFTGALLLAAGLAVLAVPGAADTSNNGTFRFLTESLPDGSTNAEYLARILTANADGAVTFGATGLPSGMAMDVQSGFITGRPTTTFNANITVTADDGTSNLNQQVHLKVNASGGGGNAGATFDVNTLPAGKVGVAYSTTLTVTNGVGPYTFGAVDLPPGLSLDGPTGVLSGSPQAAGTFFVALTVYDAGENNKVVKVASLLVEPAASAFQFTTRFLNNGEVGTPFWDQWAVSGASGAVTFGASGLPAGLSVASSTGEVSGTPTVPGTFLVGLSATDGGGTITTNLSVVIAPSSTSSLYWDFFGVPTGLAGVSYQRQPPILVAAQGGVGTLSYAAVGIPSGMTYNASSGELSGTPLDVGEYPVVFTATDGTTGDVITLSFDFLVLPTTGGDAADITVNLWPLKQNLKSGTAGKDSWVGGALWNTDRRTASVFDGTEDDVLLRLGGITATTTPALVTGTVKAYNFSSPKGEKPAVKIQVSPAKQTLKWSVKYGTFSEAVPATLEHTTILGGRGYRLDEAFDSAGNCRPALAIRRKAFVAAKGAVSAGAAGKDSVKLSLLLADPAFAYESGVSALRIRLLSGATVLLDRDFTALGSGTTATDAATGATTFSLKGLKDTAAADRLAKFAFRSTTGKMTLALSNLTLTGVPANEAHLGIELTVGSQSYFTAVTFFEGATGKYTTTLR